MLSLPSLLPINELRKKAKSSLVSRRVSYGFRISRALKVLL